MKVELTKEERAQLDVAIYEIFTDIEDYEAVILDRAVEKIVANRENKAKAYVLDVLADAFIDTDIGFTKAAERLRTTAESFRTLIP